LSGLAFEIQSVKAASETIYIRADGSIDPPTAPISTTDNITYMFTDNIYNSSGISVQKSDIVVNGNGYVLNSKYEYGRGNYGFGLSNVNNVTIKNTSIRDFGYGIIIDHSDDNVILGNNITGSLMDGVWTGSSSWNNSLYGNRVERNSYGISIFSPYNLVYGNWISNNWIGIQVDAPNINLTKNLFNSNNYQLSIEQQSSDWRNYIDFIDSSNLIDGKPVYYLLNEKDLLITPVTYPDIGYLGLVNCTNITIENLTLRSNGQGLLFANTNNSRVIHNNIESNRDNVVLSSSFDNTFSENNLTDDRFFGALLLFSSNNRFYHNNFIFGPLSLGLYNFGSTVNTWDDGYPSGGNYWSDYNGSDLYSGPYQDETGYDWIGDSPYVIDQNNIDRYPLMHLFVPEMEEIRIAYRNLLLKYDELQGQIDLLNSTCKNLQESISNLISTFNSTRDNLQGQINSLNQTCISLNQSVINLQGQLDLVNGTFIASISNLQEQQKALSNQVNTIQNALYVLAALIVILIVAIVYVVIRKPKAETKTEKETEAQ
jgi:parallel beta-helix repeat protein